MSFASKPDWDECKARYKSWWSREYIGRAGISITAPKTKRIGSIPLPPGDAERRWVDWDYITARMQYALNNTYYGGEAFPIWHAGYPGWDALPVFLGCEVQLDEDTGWWTPIMSTGELADYNQDELSIDRNNRWFRLSQEFMHRMIRESENLAVPTTGAFGGSGDTLAALRDTEKLLTDIKDDWPAVQAFEIHLMQIWIDHYQERYDLLAGSRQGSAGWFSLWSPGKFYAAQCDFSYMISTADFENCFLPAIDLQVKYLDHSVYHVDGVEAFRHVGALCSLPHLDALQILPGAGKPSPLHFAAVLKQVQDAGKNLHITIGPNEVKDALEMLRPEGLMIETWADNEDDAKDLLEYVTRHSGKRL